MSPPILLNLLFFVMITFSTTGVQNYSVVALNEAFGTPIGIANTALTANLMLSASACWSAACSRASPGTNGSRRSRSSASRSLALAIGIADPGFRC